MEDRLAPRPEDFTIRIRPGLQESQWDGTVSIDVAWKESNPLDDDDFNQIMHLTQMVCSSVPLMECDDALAKMMADYVETHYVAEEPTSNKLEVVSRESNVVKLNFGSGQNAKR